MGSAVTISGVVSPYEKKDGTRQIKLRVTYKRKTKYIPTNLFAYPSQLNRSGIIRDADLHKRVLALELQMYEKFRDIPLSKSINMNVDDIVEVLTAPEVDVPHMDLFEHMEEMIVGRKDSVRNNYHSSFNAFEAFLERRNVDVWEIDEPFLEDFISYLKKRYGERARSVSFVFGQVATVFRDARRIVRRNPMGKDLQDPFSNVESPKRPIPKHRNISRQLIQEIIDNRNSIAYKGQRRALDIMLLSFILRGMNLIDIFHCAAPVDNIITYKRIKTTDSRDDEAETKVRIPEFARGLYSKYADPKGKRAFNLYLHYSNYPCCKKCIGTSLRAAAKRLGHEKEFTHYSVRHSWGTLCRSLGIDKGVINDGLIHVDPDMKITDLYIETDYELIWKESEKMLATFDWTNL